MEVKHALPLKRIGSHGVIAGRKLGDLDLCS
jgi:hypothetical protein